MSLVWVNGGLVDKADARVGPFDHGFLYGDGVWEPFRLVGGCLPRPADHLAPLFSAAADLGIVIPHTPAALAAAISDTAAANRRTTGYGRVIVTRGPGTIGPDPRKLDPQVYITAEEYQPFPPELYGHGLHVATAPVRLDPANPAHRHRTLNQLHVVLAKRHALGNGCLEAVLLATDGAVVGGTEGRFLVVRGGVLSCPGWGDAAAVGRVEDVAAAAGLTRGHGPCSAADLVAADEVFLAGTSCGVIAVVRLDGTDIGSGTEGPFTRAVRERAGAERAARDSDTIPAEGGDP